MKDFDHLFTFTSVFHSVGNVAVSEVHSSFDLDEVLSDYNIALDCSDHSFPVELTVSVYCHSSREDAYLIKTYILPDGKVIKVVDEGKWLL